MAVSVKISRWFIWYIFSPLVLVPKLDMVYVVCRRYCSGVVIVVVIMKYFLKQRSISYSKCLSSVWPNNTWVGGRGGKGEGSGRERQTYLDVLKPAAMFSSCLCGQHYMDSLEWTKVLY
jgi:hypothetical protein